MPIPYSPEGMSCRYCVPSASVRIFMKSPVPERWTLMPDSAGRPRSRTTKRTAEVVVGADPLKIEEAVAAAAAAIFSTETAAAFPGPSEAREGFRRTRSVAPSRTASRGRTAASPLMSVRRDGIYEEDDVPVVAVGPSAPVADREVRPADRRHDRGLRSQQLSEDGPRITILRPGDDDAVAGEDGLQGDDADLAEAALVAVRIPGRRRTEGIALAGRRLQGVPFDIRSGGKAGMKERVVLAVRPRRLRPLEVAGEDHALDVADREAAVDPAAPADVPQFLLAVGVDLPLQLILARGDRHGARVRRERMESSEDIGNLRDEHTALAAWRIGVVGGVISAGDDIADPDGARAQPGIGIHPQPAPRPSGSARACAGRPLAVPKNAVWVRPSRASDVSTGRNEDGRRQSRRACDPHSSGRARHRPSSR